MTNSMDKILVSFGTHLTQDEYNLLRYDSQLDEDKKRAKELKSKIKTVTIPEFLAINPKELSGAERNVQEALRFIYDLNGKEPPLYKEFPVFREKERPLTINITTADDGKDSQAVYCGFSNEIRFKKDSRIGLINSLAHELKHAEQLTEETSNLEEILAKNNAYGLHQLKFLKEAQAYACGAYVAYESLKSLTSFSMHALDDEVILYRFIKMFHPHLWGRVYAIFEQMWMS